MLAIHGSSSQLPAATTLHGSTRRDDSRRWNTRQRGVRRSVWLSCAEEHTRQPTNALGLRGDVDARGSLGGFRGAGRLPQHLVRVSTMGRIASS